MKEWNDPFRNRSLKEDIVEMDTKGYRKLDTLGSDILPIEESVQVPSLQALNLQGHPKDLAKDLCSAGRISLVLICWHKLSADQIKDYIEPWTRSFSNQPQHFQLVQVTLMGSRAMSIVRTALVRGLEAGNRANGLPVSADASTLLHIGPTLDFRRNLNLLNINIGYALLVDKAGRVRWRRSGDAESVDVAECLAAARAIKNNSPGVSRMPAVDEVLARWDDSAAEEQPLPAAESTSQKKMVAGKKKGQQVTSSASIPEAAESQPQKDGEEVEQKQPAEEKEPTEEEKKKAEEEEAEANMTWRQKWVRAKMKAEEEREAQEAKEKAKREAAATQAHKTHPLKGDSQ